MSRGNVFNPGPVSFQILLHMLEEPWLVVVANSVYLQGNIHSLANPNMDNNDTLPDNIKYIPKIPLPWRINIISSVTVQKSLSQEI